MVRIARYLFSLLLLPSLASAQIWEKPISPGITYRMEVDAKTPLVVHSLRISPHAPGVTLSTELAGGTIDEDGTTKGRLGPSKIMQQTGAIAAINGDFFSFTQGAPIGLMVRKGELLTTPAKARGVFGWGSSFGMAVPAWTGKVSGTNWSANLDAVNQPAGANQVVLYTSAEGNLSTPEDGAAAVLDCPDKLTPTGSHTCTVQRIIQGVEQIKGVPNFVLVGRGSKAQSITSLKPGDQVTVLVEVEGFDWKSITNAIGGGPVLMRNGAIAIDAADEGFKGGFLARNPRSAIGRTAQGDLLLVAIDGRQPMSAGATIEEEAAIMKNLGCTDAMNLDGGGSTDLTVRGVTVNRPSDKVERAVSNVILVFGPGPEPSTDSPKIDAPPAVVEDSDTQLKVLAGSKILDQRSVLWSAMGSAWIDQGGMLHAFLPGVVTVTAYADGQILTAKISVTPSEEPQDPSKARSK